MEQDLIARAWELLTPCRLCARRCLARRLEGEIGQCRTTELAVVASSGAHFGEEPVLVGKGGSGAIFFAGCNLDCVFCQNYNISHEPGGLPVTTPQLARLMLTLQERGCSNVNLVSPTHVAPQILEAILEARHGGLRVPVIYNSGGYESLDMLRLLEGLIDVYMPDFKYASAASARKYSGIKDYPKVARAALGEMFRQVGPLQLDEHDLACRGVLVRHLVLPVDIGESQTVIDIVAEVAPGCAINIMDQYRPCYRAAEFPELLVMPKRGEVRRLREYAESKGLVRMDQSPVRQEVG